MDYKEINKLKYYTNIENENNIKEYEKKLFINLSLKEIFQNLVNTIIIIINEIFNLDENNKTIKNYILICFKEDRLIYVGIVLIILSMLLLF